MVQFRDTRNQSTPKQFKKVASTAHNNTYNEIWGIVVNDIEYAIIGSTYGTHFIDVTDPDNVQEVQRVRGAAQGTPIVHRDYHDHNGFLYAVCDEGGDANSVKSIEWARAAMKKFGLEYIEVTVSTSAEVHMAAQSLADRVDAVFIISDNTVVSAFESLVKVCNDKNKPLFGGGTESVPRGAIAALGFDYFEVGFYRTG